MTTDVTDAAAADTLSNNISQPDELRLLATDCLLSPEWRRRDLRTGRACSRV